MTVPAPGEPDYELLLALAEDRAEDAERELAAIRWRQDIIGQVGLMGLWLNPVTSTTDEVCDVLVEWAAEMEKAGLADPRYPLPMMLEGIERARTVYA
jgi:uncharacterized protein YgfB (UPF0149 family)